MSRGQIERRIGILARRSTARLDRFRPFAAAVIRLAGEEPPLEREASEVGWLNRYRRQEWTLDCR